MAPALPKLAGVQHVIVVPDGPLQSLPFAILVYDPAEEWGLRRQARKLGTRLENKGRQVEIVSLAELLWKAIDDSEGLDVVEHGLPGYPEGVLTGAGSTTAD